MKPAGMECFEAVLRTFLRDFSPVEQEEGGGREAKSVSVSWMQEGQSARLKLK